VQVGNIFFRKRQDNCCVANFVIGDFFVLNSSVKQSPIQMSLAEFLSTENCQCLVLLFPRLHCVLHACIQMWFSEIVLLISTIITVASSYQLMSHFNCFFFSPVDDLCYAT
jgi:hypothetical protein